MQYVMGGVSTSGSTDFKHVMAALVNSVVRHNILCIDTAHPCDNSISVIIYSLSLWHVAAATTLTLNSGLYEATSQSATGYVTVRL